METKQKITLTKEQETLLIPLYSKARENPILQDDRARQVLESVAYDFGALRVPEKTVVTLLLRAKQLDAYTSAFLRRYPGALVLHLGCGLDSRCLRVSEPRGCWFDLDLPDVIALRRAFYAETGSYRMIAASVSEPGWLEQIPADGRPVLVIAEGLLMYLREAEVRALLLRLRERFPGCHMAFDAFSKLTVERISAHPSLKKTGAIIHWGIDDPHEIEGWAPGILLKEEWFFSQSAEVGKLSRFYRFMFRLTARIAAAQKAQRLLYYVLGTETIAS